MSTIIYTRTDEAPVDIGGYNQPVEELTSAAMRPSETLNAIIDSI